jgi:hypothetical protein
MKKIYIIWNDLEDRPLINKDNFGNLLFYLTKEQAQARLLDQAHWISDSKEQKPQFSIKEAKFKLVPPQDV